MYSVTNLVLNTKTMRSAGKTLEILYSRWGEGDNKQVNKCKLTRIVKRMWKKIKQGDGSENSGEDYIEWLGKA